MVNLFNAVSNSTFTINYSTPDATAFNLPTPTATASYKVVKNSINTSFTIHETIKKAILLK